MRHWHMPLTERRRLIFVITEPDDFRHFFLHVRPIERKFLFRILRNRPRRVVNRIAPENEKRFDLAAIHSVG